MNNKSNISALWISNKNVTNQMYSDLVIPYHDVENCVSSTDQNKSMEDNQSYLGMNSMEKVAMACLKNMNDVPTKDYSLWMKTFGLISREMLSPSSLLWLYLS